MILLTLALTAALAAPPAAAVSPPAVVLDAPEASDQLLVTTAAGADATRRASYAVADPAVAAVGPDGLVVPRGDGATTITVTTDGHALTVPVTVTGMKSPPAVSFEQDVIPALTKASCNAGGCHGKAEGQNNFKLSVFGFDPAADHEAIVRESRGRRVMAAAADHSLFLLKGTAAVPHGGGKKLEKDSPRYRRIARWIAEGGRLGAGQHAEAVALEVEPARRTFAGGAEQQLRVVAVYADGRRRGVTTEAEYESNADFIAAADRRGLVKAGAVPGGAAVLVRYMGRVATCRVTVPQPGGPYPRPPEVNFIDRHAWDQLARLGIAPGELADDATFLRRASLDVTGTLPTAAEARAFLADADPKKREKLVERLLARPEYPDYWAMRWADLLRVDKDAATPEGAVAMTRWLRKQFAANRPFDAVARDVVTTAGPVAAEGPAAFFKVHDQPEEAARAVSQLFLGVRIECAQCHHHPSERWGQDDYFALAGLFTGAVLKPVPGGGQAVSLKAAADLKHPRTKQPVPAKPLGAAAVPDGADRRRALADWMTAPDNPYFAAVLANRLFGHYLGRGLVEPADDFRATNPATNEPLLADLAKHLRDVKYDLKAFTRTLLASRLYQLAPASNPSNARDAQNYSHARPKPLPAEVLLDAISQVTGVPEKFMGWPEGARAVQVWDNRMPSYFFRIFGRPVRYSVCSCERSDEPSIAQALHLMNAPEVAAKVRSRRGTARRLADGPLAPAAVVDELYLTALARYPSAAERAAALEAFAGPGADRRSAAEDVMWALVNTKEFVFNR